uniref:Uncharacterized protein n=1 Tax=Glossina pallidipes TaxID=7398 RepID=A0A1A9ZZI6_GLOPL
MSLKANKEIVSLKVKRKSTCQCAGENKRKSDLCFGIRVSGLFHVTLRYVTLRLIKELSNSNVCNICSMIMTLILSDTIWVFALNKNLNKLSEKNIFAISSLFGFNC